MTDVLAKDSTSVKHSGGKDASPLLTLRGISKTYDGETLVVNNLNLDIPRGEFLTLLGPSGSGKTSTLLMIAGFEAPTRGDIVLDGRSLRNLPPYKRDIGVVFQNYALFPHMTVGQNIGFPLSVRGVTSAEIARRVDHALRTVELHGFVERLPSQLSGGQQQRVALARALVFEPKLILLDEPLGALDRQLREHMQLEIRALHKRLGLTAVYVTHDQSEALSMSDRVAVFANGVVQQLDSPRALYETPRNAFVARFIGENNRLNGTIERREGKGCLVRLGHGGALKAAWKDVDGVGNACTVSIRPERVRIVPAEHAKTDDTANSFPATIREVIFLGDHCRLVLEVPSVGQMTAKAANDALVSEPRPGGGWVAQWTEQDCLAFAAEPDIRDTVAAP